ncbi:MAG: sugar phosphate nucleotidyltransferase [Lachnospiraceae bacterium]|nr:sugar phosphate nucleotidyltransferase [Lachnospiraceae bacterium]
MKGIILAAGKGTRLHPITQVTAKTLLPIYDKPMIYYPLTTMIELGIKDILLIVDSATKNVYQHMFGDGSQLGINLQLMTQPVQRGIADAFILGEDFIGNDSVCLILGDNIFLPMNRGMKDLIDVENFRFGAVVTACKVRDPQRFGVVEFDEDGKVLSIEEKPKEPKSDYIIPGLYFYDSSVVNTAKNLEPSALGELEITDVNQRYLNISELKVAPLTGISWYDTGTPDSMADATTCIQAMKKCGVSIGYPEIAALDAGFISIDEFQDLIPSYTCDYARTLTEYLKAKSGLNDKEE